MPNQYSNMTRENILRKLNRKRNPVTSLTQLAEEFGYNTEYTRIHDGRGRENMVDRRPPHSFTRKVKALVGAKTYKRIQQSKNVNLAYR